MVHLPADTNLLAGEGWIDVKERRRLYLFLVGIGENSGTGTYNVGEGDCPVYIDEPTHRVFFKLPIDKDFGVADGSCSDRTMDGGSGYSGTRSWKFKAVSPPDPKAAR